MKYRAKCTNCISQVMNAYNINKYPILRDARDFYVEVDSEYQAELIEELDKHMKEAVKIYTTIVNINSK